ncbi:MAG: hypothetical protein P8O16_04040 [Algoriphagus sp.]|uniref:hypothetical protein n=1 Tax=Algoriphagus sp. TaxID=1872435 RepID=UPI002614042A|nr:hypothetical protein [Algoriphagus sp.]MDG1276426.1 hypothetical protein [Algoriphagus sp.]
MLLALLETYFLNGLTLLVLVSIGLLHFLLFREYSKQEKLQSKRLQDLENLVTAELFRSKSMSIQNRSLNQIKAKTQEQLELIKLQVDAMKSMEKKKSNS